MKRKISKHASLSNQIFFRQAGKYQSIQSDYLLSYQGRYAFFQALKLMKLKENDEILLPSYHCLSMISPMLQYGCKINFYKIHKNLQTTLDDIKDGITLNTKAVLLVHYFGLKQNNIEEIKELLTKKNIFLIEDCAHIIPLKKQTAGKIGDISIFSPRKFLPIIDGALIRINNPDLPQKFVLKKMPVLRELKTYKNTFEQQLNELHGGLGKLYRIFDKIAGKLKSNAYPVLKGHKTTHNLPVDFDVNLTNVQCSGLSSYVMSSANFENIFQKRRRNFQFLFNKFYEGSLLKLPEFLKSEPLDCLLGFPLILDNRKKAILALKNRKIQTFTFGEKLFDQDVKINDMVDATLTQKLFFIPIHQDLDDNDLEYILGALKEILLVNI